MYRAMGKNVKLSKMTKEQLISKCQLYERQIDMLQGKIVDLSIAYDSVKRDTENATEAYDDMYDNYRAEYRRRVALENRGFWSRLFNLEE